MCIAQKFYMQDIDEKMAGKKWKQSDSRQKENLHNLLHMSGSEQDQTWDFFKNVLHATQPP